MPSAPQSYELFGNVLTFRALPSKGAPYLLVECHTAPGAGAPMNSHAGDEESFYVLSGHYAFDIDGRQHEAGPGDHVAIPAGAPHAFRNIGSDAAIMLILNWPGTQHEAFFSKLGRPVEPGTQPIAPAGPPPSEAVTDMRRLGLSFGIDLAI